MEKNSWGFQKLDFSADADFIHLERNMVTTDEFVGNSYQLDYIIEEEKLHAGRNYGTIRIKTNNQELRYEILVTKKGTKEKKRTVLKSQCQIEKLVSLASVYRQGRFQWKNGRFVHRKRAECLL